MSDVLHGTATWPGALANISCAYTVSHGISPGVATFIMAAQPGRPPAGYGDLTITDGQRSVTLRDCKVDRMDSDKSGSVWQLYIFDRRWKWAFKTISGRYNERDDFNELKPETKRSALELAILCLNRMGELDTAGVDGLPTDQYPPVDWVAENPAAALEGIAGQYGCRVVYQPIANRVLVALVGVGADLPGGPLAKETPALDFPETPDSILLVGAPTEYETYLPLEAVMMDADGEVKPIDKISYKPDNGWTFTCPGNQWGLKRLKPDPKYEELNEEELNKKIEGLFLDTYLKWYRVKMTSVDGLGSDLEIPRYGRVKDRRQIILSDHRAKTIANWDGALIAAPAEVRGKFVRWRQKKEAAQDAFATSLPTEKTDTPYSVDANTGIVKFQDPMQIVRSALGEVNDPLRLTYPAELILRCAVTIRAPGSGELERYFRERDLGGRNGTGPEVVKRPEVALKVIGKYAPRQPQTGPFWTLIQADDNIVKVQPLADAFLERAARRYEIAAAESREYPAVATIDPDGAIQQVTWRVGGGAPPLTSASRNSEHAFWLLSYEELRRVRLAREEAKPLNTARSMKAKNLDELGISVILPKD
jgi:hypothetical protein